MARSLFVPVHLHARLVTATTASLPGLGAPFTEPTAGLPPGVHLHWALPDALTRAQVDPLAQTLRFPAVPDRWLVVRFADAPTFATGGLRPPPRACKAFVVDAKNRKSGPLGAVAFTPVAEWLTVMGLLPGGVKTDQGDPLPQDIHLEAAYYPAGPRPLRLPRRPRRPRRRRLERAAPLVPRGRQLHPLVRGSAGPPRRRRRPPRVDRRRPPRGRPPRARATSTRSPSTTTRSSASAASTPSSSRSCSPATRRSRSRTRSSGSASSA
jgi:hypothetical protein